MAKVTWLGEDTEEYAGPSFTTCFERKFHKGKPVEITDPDTIRRAQKNQFFEVSGIPGRPPNKMTDVQNAG